VPSRPSPRRARRTLLLVVPPVAVAVAAGLWLTDRSRDDSRDPGNETSATATTTRAPGPSDSDLATLGPERTGGVPVPTEPPAEVATDAPPTPVVPVEDSAAPSPESVDVFLTFAGWEGSISAVEAGGYVAGPLGDGGTCTLTLTGAGSARSASGAGISDATTVSCGTLRIAGDQLSAGTWEAVLSYESGDTGGRSAPIEVQVP
jgi:hypothetical protein